MPARDSWGQAATAIVEVSESEYRVLSDYIVATFIGDKGENQVGRRVSNIVLINETRSDRNDSKIEDDDGKPLSWRKISAYLHKEMPTLQRAVA